MADSTVASLAASDALAGTELFYADGLASAAAADVKVTATKIKTWTSASPTLVTPNLGTPSAGVLTNVTGTAAGLTAGNVTTNANLTGPITSVGNTTSITSQTGTGTKFVVDTSPTLVTPVIGIATGTSLALSGVALGTNVFAAAGTGLFNLNAASAPTGATGTGIQLVGTDATVTRFEADSFGAIGAFTIRRANGTGASPTALTSSDQIGAFNFHGYYVTGGPGYSSVQASVSALATQNWTSTNQGTQILFRTTPNNSTTLTTAMTLGQDQSVTLASTSPLFWSTDVNISRNAAGIIQFGTTVANAAGSWLATNGTLTGTLNAGSTTVANLTTGSAQFIQFGIRSAIDSPADGVVRIANNTQTDFTRLQLGGSTSSFPAIGRSTTRLVVQLADGTAGGGINLTTASILSIASGTNQRAGNATLVGGTVTVSNTTVTANTIVMLTRKTSGGTIGTAITYTLSAGASFTVNSDNILDTSTFSYVLIEVP